MTTLLSKPLKREIVIKGRRFVVTLSPEGIKVTLKGKRKGQELRWEDLVSGEAALAVALNASLKEVPESPVCEAKRESKRSPSKPASRRRI